jgi:flagellar motor switch protein FliM
MDSILTPSEIEALLKATDAAGAATKAVKPVDLVARDHQAFALLPKLQEAADRLAVFVSRLCTQLVRMPCKAAADAVEVMPGSRLSDYIEGPRFLFGIRVGSCAGAGVITIDSILGGTFVERQFGGELDLPASSDGPPTATERRTVSRLGGKIVEALANVMQSVSPMQASVEPDLPELTKNPARAVAVVLLVLRVTLGENRSTITIAIDTAAAGFKVAQRATSEIVSGQLAGGLLRVPVAVSAILGTAEVPVNRVLALQPGEVFVLDTPTDAEIPLLVEGRAKFLGVPAITRGSLSLQIARAIEE